MKISSFPYLQLSFSNFSSPFFESWLNPTGRAQSKIYSMESLCLELWSPLHFSHSPDFCYLAVRLDSGEYWRCQSSLESYSFASSPSCCLRGRSWAGWATHCNPNTWPPLPSWTLCALDSNLWPCPSKRKEPFFHQFDNQVSPSTVTCRSS